MTNAQRGCPLSSFGFPHSFGIRHSEFAIDYLRWRILARMRRFLRPTFRRPEPRRLLPMLDLLDLTRAHGNVCQTRIIGSRGFSTRGPASSLRRFFPPSCRRQVGNARPFTQVTPSGPSAPSSEDPSHTVQNDLIGRIRQSGGSSPIAKARSIGNIKRVSAGLTETRQIVQAMTALTRDFLLARITDFRRELVLKLQWKDGQAAHNLVDANLIPSTRDIRVAGLWRCGYTDFLCRPVR